jgi:hypothetical protein
MYCLADQGGTIERKRKKERTHVSALATVGLVLTMKKS